MRPSVATATKFANPTKVLNLLKKHYPNAHCALVHSNPFELLVATILSAQCTDERVNKITPPLFLKYPTPKKMGEAPIEDLENMIRSTGFFKNKAKNIKSCAQTLVERYGGKVPASMEALTLLPGVGRKTANVVLGNAFQISSGVVVDTHVTRLANRFGWTQSENAEVIERELNQLIPEKDWILISHLLIWHGRQICQARKPQCQTCFLFDLCPQIDV
ncbi:MAG: endonuclease III [Oligoflexia bacterium]|nr:MAG: endonuclease III [Oligoflexia bacterium]